MAAAFAALVSLFNDLELILNHPLHSFSFDNNQIQSLIESVSFLIEFMESYDNCNGPIKEAAQVLEGRITCVAQAAEEVIGSHVVDQILDGSTLGGKKISPRFLLDLEEVIQDIDCVRREAVKLQQARSGLELKQPTYTATASSSSSSSSTQPLTSEKTTMVGFDELLLQLLDFLTGYPSSRRVIPIVGTAGVGKTTIAINAFQHSLTVQHFDVCLWVTISQQYVVQDILFKLLSRQGNSNSETIGELGEMLHKRLYGRRYLIVLDDMWNVAAWDAIKSFLPDTNDGSRIVVTTRQSNIADQIGSASPLVVSVLDDEKSWDLFCQKAFAGDGCPPEFEDVGKKIMKKCKGLPLAIIVVAGHLRKSSKTLKCWKNVADNMNSILISEENEYVLNILSFSYSYLPVCLKPCFIYMGTFCEDEEIYVPDLIKYWIAEGFLKPCKADSLEEIAKDYLKDLIDRNLISPSKGDREDSHCKIHDVLREFCLKVAESEMFFYVHDMLQAICRERRVGIREKVPEQNHHPEIFHAPRSVPLVRFLDDWRTPKQWTKFGMGLCRLMNSHNLGQRSLEAALQHINIRYLKYRGSRDDFLTYIPSSISMFWNLQTLIIESGFHSLVIAPNEIWEMIQLRHLEVFREIHLPDPLSSDKLERENELVMHNLHTLLRVKNFKFSDEVCKRVPNIKELTVVYSDVPSGCTDIKELTVEYSDEVMSYYCPHNLGCFGKLESLKLFLDSYSDSVRREFALSLTFSSSLKELSLRGCCLDWEEMTMMVGSLPYLQTLSLWYNAITAYEWTPIEGKFLGLKSLSIAYCDDLVKWNADNSHFPVLETLLLEGLDRLDEFPSDIGAIPTLRSISLEYCNVSLAISAVRMLVEQEECGNEDLSIYVNCKGFKKKMEEEGLTPNNLRSSSW